MIRPSEIALACCLAVSMACHVTSTWAAPPVSFDRDIRPILSDKCFACHGPDEHAREADLRLDLRDEAVDHGSLIPGDAESELLQRIVSEDEDLRMPPPHTQKEISAEEAELIRRWITDGAEYETHWAYRPLARPTVPVVTHERNAGVIDAFLLKDLGDQQLDFSPRADRVTLIRRLYLDLLGVPPTSHEVEAFASDSAPSAWEDLVDRMLKDPRFGERMAVYWLDLVRYADTIGYHSDTYMEVSAYRDYVINSLNDNKPFDQFTVEQLAGDLLPQPTQTQLIASGYNRLLQTTEEGGAQAKEYEAIYAADRVRNVAGVWMGATVGCAQCHDHKYDPITTRDFYSLAAFFSDIKENSVGKRQPNLKLYTDQDKQQIAELETKIAALRLPALLDANPQLAEELAAGQQRWEAQAITAADSDESLSDELRAALRTAAAERTAEQQQLLAEHYRDTASELVPWKKKLADAEKELQDYEAGIRTMLVTETLDQPRLTRILPRGNWLDESGEVVQPAVPQFLSHSNPDNRRATRLDLAKWLVADDNPLTSRTFVNRLWKLFFGRGLSRNLDDLGGQGQPPTHPQLLDWLAVEFRSSGWDIKHMVRLLVTSEAYAQSSAAAGELRAADPQNRWFARQGRWRLDAEFVRDNLLQVSGLLSDHQVGGRSVKPYQPAGYWQHLNFPKREWQADHGDRLYRRSLYTFWCRTFLHPSMLAFDATSREECTAERAKSNIPQQALVLLNDPAFLEASRVFAGRILEADGDEESKIRWAMREAVSRAPVDDEVTLLVALYRDQLARYRSAPDDAKALLSVGAAENQHADRAAELAAWTQVARAIFNLYETTSRY